jgi:hypothetical protein
MRSFRAAAARSRRPEDQPARCASGVTHARSICTSEQCPMAQILQAMPHLCAPEPPREAQPPVAEEDRQMLARFAEVRPYADSVWGPAAWTALQADILSLPRELDAHEFCMFKVYLALRARYLPCSACALHFERHLRKMPNHATMRTRAGLLRWLTTVHNDVNRRKQRIPLPETQILDILHAKAAMRAEGEAEGEGEGEAEAEAEEEEGEAQEAEPAEGEEASRFEAAAPPPPPSSSSRRASPGSARFSSSSSSSSSAPLSLPAAIPIALGISAAVVAGALVAMRSGRRSRASRRSPRP